MRTGWLKCLLPAGYFLFLSLISGGQNCIPTGIQGTTINLLCNQVCSTLVFQVPHLKSTDNYTITNVPYNPYPYSTPTGLEDPTLYADDQYSFLINLPFTFCFYGANYPTTVVGSNGIMTFDPSNASCANAWPITTTIPFAGGTICSAGSTYYPRASIMGAYSDLDPRLVASPSNRKIQWETIGTAPCRKFVVSYYRVGVFGNNACGQATPNTLQMVIHESTGIIEIFTEQKACASSTNAGRGIQGIQNWNRDAAVWVTGRNNTFWTDNNSGYQFVPSGATSHFVIAEMLDMSGAVVATADTLTTTAGLLDIRFPNFCPPAGSTQYVVRTQFSACDNPANMLISLDTITVNRTNSLNATASATLASCGPPDGTITVTVPSGVGTPPYTYVLDGGTPVVANSPYTFINVAAGPHTIVVTDASGGCTSTININVNISGNISATTTTTATACVGVNNGSITITSAGGTGPYTFSLNGGAPVAGTLPFTFNNLPAGNHTIVVYDAGTGCNSGNITVTIAVGPGVSGSATTTPAACPGVNTGSITVTALTGTPPFEWSLDGGAFVPGASPYTFTNVSAGGHNIVIRDANGCTILVVANVGFGSGVTANAATTATSCPGVNNGTITVTATAGTAPFTWSLDGGAPQSGPSPYTFTGVSPGNHTVLVTDAVGCMILVTVNVATGAGLTASISTTATACTGVNNGSITITSVTGTGPYNFSLNGSAPLGGALPFTFSNVPAGNHTVEITDANGCTTGMINVNVATGPGVSGNAVTTATSCPTAANGSITVDATAGTPPFTYQLDGGTPQSGANPFTFTNVTAGNHTIVITDNFGCTLTLNNVMVNAGPVLTANTVPAATSCSGAANGSITITPVGGTAPFEFILNGGTPQAGAVPFTFSNLPAGNHTVEVTDAAGCATAIINVTVPAGPVLTTTVTPSNVLCNGGSTGSITVTPPAIGTPPFEYSLDNINWQSSNTFSGLPAGSYTVYFRESNGCTGQQTVMVNEPAALSSSAAVVAVTCNGGNDGSITITAGGGISPYEYSIDAGASWQSNNVFTVPFGNYTIIIRDANGCTRSQNATVTEPAALVASSVNQNASCDGGNDGSITVTASGGNSGGYQYSIDGISFQSSNIFNVPPGTYTVTVRDNMGCTTSFTAVVDLSNNLTFTPLSDPTICEGSSTTLNFVSNATSWSWSPGAGLSSTTIANPVANPTVSTQYVVTATLDRCSATDTVIVNVNPAPIPNAGADGFICYGQSYQLQGSGGVVYSWSPSNFLNNPSIPNPVSTADQTITYTLSILADANGCPSLVTDNMTVDVTPPVKVYTFPADTILYPGDQVQIKAISPVQSANIFNWTPSFNLSNPSVDNPILTAGNIGDSIVYKVTATSAAGCIGEGYVRLRVYKGPDIYVPTAFTPNGDGKNDRFYPFPVGIKAINYFKVFNRWGQEVFSSNVLYKGWDGKYNGMDQASGVYVWMAQAVDKDNKLITKKGTVTLIR